MLDRLPPLRYLLLVFAGWANRQQLYVIDYLKEENRVLREILGEQRLRFTDAQRRRLAEKVKRLGRKVLNVVLSLPAAPMARKTISKALPAFSVKAFREFVQGH